jgi:hypothetical protein
MKIFLHIYAHIWTKGLRLKAGAHSLERWSNARERNEDGDVRKGTAEERLQ